MIDDDAKSRGRVHRTVKKARKDIQGDESIRQQALLNPIKFLGEAPYNMTMDEISLAYSDPALNIAHPDHPYQWHYQSGVGCILCG